MTQQGTPAENLQRLTVFGDSTSRPTGLFHGGRVSVLFAEATVDLRQATLPSTGARLEAHAVFGEIRVLAPPGCKIVVSGTTILGELDSGPSTPDPAAPVLEVRGTAVFGHVRVRMA